MSDETNTTDKPRRGRPPKGMFPEPIEPGHSGIDPQGVTITPKLIPSPPIQNPDAKSTEWMDWIFTHLPLEMARNFYGGINYTARS